MSPRYSASLNASIISSTGSSMYLAKSSGPVYMGVEYGVFGKFRFMTQAAYDALSSYDSDTVYFVRSLYY